jgi:hypothetical protein
MAYANASATVPEPCQVLGTPLKPFCLGHHLLLSRLGSPLADNPLARVDRESLILAIAVCAGESYESTLAAMLGGDWPVMVERWTRRLRGPWWRRRKVDWGHSEMLFRAYLADGYQNAPVNRYPGSGDIEITAPWEELILCRLVMAGFAPSFVFNAYLPAAWYHYFTVIELDQLARFATPANQFQVEDWRKVFHTKQDAMRMALV